MNSKILSKFESLFENEDQFSNLRIINDEQKNFIAEENNQLLESIDFASGPEQWSILFSRLHLFFELGFHIKDNKVKNYFYMGECFQKQNLRVKLNIPNSNYFNILKTSAKSLLKKFNLQEMKNSNKMTALLIRLDSENTIILFTTLAEPWLKLRCESLHRCLINHDYFTNETHG